MNQLFIYISVASPLLGIILGIKNKARFHTALSLVFYLCIASFIADIISLMLSNNQMNNLIVIHVWGLAQGLLLLIFFGRVLLATPNSIKISLILFITLYIFNSAFIEGISNYNSIAMSIQALIMIVLSIFYLYSVYVNEYDVFIEQSPQFWIVIGILFYFSGALFSFLLSSDILSQNPDRFYNSWILHNIANILKNILFAIGLWKVRKLA